MEVVSEISRDDTGAASLRLVTPEARDPQTPKKGGLASSRSYISTSVPDIVVPRLPSSEPSNQLLET
jgi:hypothetical protein